MNTLKFHILLPIIVAGTLFVVILVSLLYVFGSCSDLDFPYLMLISFLQITGGSGAGMELQGEKGYCNSVFAINTLLNVAFKSVAFAVLVSKLQTVRPRMYFTPFCVLNFRDKKPVLQMRVLNAQGSILEIAEIRAQWVEPHKTMEGERYGQLHELKLTAFQKIKSPISISHVIDEGALRLLLVACCLLLVACVHFGYDDTLVDQSHWLYHVVSFVFFFFFFCFCFLPFRVTTAQFRFSQDTWDVVCDTRLLGSHGEKGGSTLDVLQSLQGGTIRTSVLGCQRSQLSGGSKDGRESNQRREAVCCKRGHS